MARPYQVALLILGVFGLITTLSSVDAQHHKSRERRASLHELLMKNRNIASTGPEAVYDTPEQGPPVPNDNRRVLVLGEGQDPPNYVYDDEPPTQESLADEGRDLAHYDTDDVNTDASTNDVGDRVTSYATSYAAVDAPSYADPGLLAAVMDQADKANFRFPDDENKIISPTDQEISGSAKIETVSNPEKNEIDPFKLFPPSFHDLLEIPLHTYSNGSTFNPHKKEENKPSSPIITGGYANTNINGKDSTQNVDISKVKNFKPTRLRNKYQKPSVKRNQDQFKTTTVTTPVDKSSRIRFPGDRKRQNYVNFNKRPERRRNPGRIPPPDKTSLRRRPVRPSLRFRTRVPPVSTEHNWMMSTTSVTPPPVTTTTTTSTTTTEVPKRRVARPFGRPNSQKSPEDDGSIDFPFRKVALDKPDISFQQIKDKFPTFLEIDGDDFKHQSPPADQYRETLKDYIPPIYQSNNAEEPTIVKMKPFNRFEDFTTSIPTVYETEYPTQSIESYSPDTQKAETYFSRDIPKLPRKTSPKIEFKPSKIDPFHGNPLFTDNRPQELHISPTTFRPDRFTQSKRRHHITPTTFRPSTRVIPPVVNTYDRKSDEQNYFYNNFFTGDGLPYINTENERKQPQFQDSDFTHRPQSHDNVPAVNHRIPVYVSSPISPISTGAHIIQQQYNKYDSHSPRISNLQPPRRVFSGPVPQTMKIPYEQIPQRRRTRRPNVRRRPSFLEKLGFFRSKKVNRSGESGPLSDVNAIQKTDSKNPLKSPIDYVLSHGPLPFNGKKVVVFGPFKEPPIGAPRIYPTNQLPTFQSSIKPSQSIGGLKPPSNLAHSFPTLKLQSREPSFKVFSLPKESVNGTDRKGYESEHVVVRSKFDVGKPPMKVNGIVLPSKVPNGIFRPDHSSSSIKRSHIDHNSAFGSKRLPLKVDHKNYHLFEEVSDADKERLIAAKFEFSRPVSVGRSGLERHIIPIPVPMMTSSGKQVSSFRSIQVPHASIIRKIGRTPLIKSNAAQFVPEARSNLEVQSPAPQDLNTNVMRITPYPKSSPVQRHDDEEPQSYHEPSASDVKFEGWNALGERPVLSYIKENTPRIAFKKGKLEQSHSDESNVNFNPDKTNEEGNSKPQGKGLDTSSPEKKFVRISSELNVETPEVVNTFLVNPPRRL